MSGVRTSISLEGVRPPLPARLGNGTGTARGLQEGKGVHERPTLLGGMVRLAQRVPHLPGEKYRPGRAYLPGDLADKAD